MNIEKIIFQLSSLKDNSQSFIGDQSDEIWKQDVEALEETIGILQFLFDDGISTTETFYDDQHDRKLMQQDYKRMHEHFRAKAKPVHKDGV